MIAQEGADHATHLLVSKGLLAKERKLIPISWVKIINEDQVQLTVESREFEALADYPS